MPEFVLIGKTSLSFYRFDIFLELMTLKLRCDDYGFECKYEIDAEKTVATIEKLRNHFEEEHGIDYTVEVVTQMIQNRGHSLESIRK